MNEDNFDTLLDSSLNQLSKEIQPERDLWQGIEYAIEIHESSNTISRKKWLSVAIISALVLGGSWTFYPQFGSLGNTPLNASAEVSTEVSMAKLVEDMGRSFSLKKAQMLTSYEGVSPLASNWMDQLGELEEAREGVWTALEESPDNVYMIQILQHIHDRQLNLIESVHPQVNRSI